LPDKVFEEAYTKEEIKVGGKQYLTKKRTILEVFFVLFCFVLFFFNQLSIDSSQAELRACGARISPLQLFTN